MLIILAPSNFRDSKWFTFWIDAKTPTVRRGAAICGRVDSCLSGQPQIQNRLDRLVLKRHDQKALLGCALLFSLGDFVYDDRVFLALEKVIKLLMLLVDLKLFDQQSR